MMQKVFAIVGTRPEAVKMAPVIEALRRRESHDVKVISTGQHHELLRQTLWSFGIRPDIELAVMQPGQILSELTARLMVAIDPLLEHHAPSMVIAQGDTTSVMAAALLSFYRHIPFAHVEAGLRTGDIRSPFPEEFNRIVAGRLAALHFAPTPRAAQNLRAEGIASDAIYVTGNTVIDALLKIAARGGSPPVPLEAGRRLILVTCHRRENFGAPLGHIFSALKRLLIAHPDCDIVFPVHPNPIVRSRAFHDLGGDPRIHLVEPLSYEDLVATMQASFFVMTDSGGIQEEAPSLHKPVLVLRQSTERPEAIEAGVAELAGTDEDFIFEKANRLLSDPLHYARMASGANPYGDGHAAMRIADLIDTFLHQRTQALSHACSD